VRFLFIKADLAWPRSRGHDVHAYHLMQALAGAGHAVSLATFVPAVPNATFGLGLKNLLCLAPKCEGFGNHLVERMSCYRQRFLSYFGLEPWKIAAVAEAAERCQADTVVIEGFDLLPCAAGVRGAARVWHAADEYALADLSQAHWRHPATWRNVWTATVNGLYERAFGPLLDQVWVVSERDRRAMRLIAGVQAVTVVPNGVDAEHFAPGVEEVRPRSCVFWGRLDAGPNVQAVQWFCQKVWPALRQEVEDAQLTLLGFHPTAPVRELGQLPGVILMADLPDIRAEIRRQALTVLPFVSGGGIKNKLLEAAALEQAIVCTPTACNGLRGRPPVRRAQTPGEWVAAIRQLWSDDAERRRLGKAARRWVMAEHSWTRAAQLALDSLSSNQVNISQVGCNCS
jgi:polysaccharide biosynthesis protein PslH